MKENIFWYLLIIKNSNVITGSNLYQLFQIIFKNLPVKNVGLDDVEGVNNLGLIVIKEMTYQDQNEFLNFLQSIKHLEWADFFLLSDRKTLEDKKKSYPSLIKQTLTTVRIVDNTDTYVYTPLLSLVEEIRKNYSDIEMKRSNLEDLDYPF